jgi:hypothetical protein
LTGQHLDALVRLVLNTLDAFPLGRTDVVLAEVPSELESAWSTGPVQAAIAADPGYNCIRFLSEWFPGLATLEQKPQVRDKPCSFWRRKIPFVPGTSAAFLFAVHLDVVSVVFMEVAL